jgi:hypothetical protein
MQFAHGSSVFFKNKKARRARKRCEPLKENKMVENKKGPDFSGPFRLL